MAVEDVGDEVMRFAMRLAGLVVAVPLVAGFVTLGAAVLVGRSVREATRRAGALLAWGKSRRPEARQDDAKAA